MELIASIIIYGIVAELLIATALFLWTDIESVIKEIKKRKGK